MVSKNCKQVLKATRTFAQRAGVWFCTGTGKSKLLAEVALAFETAFGLAPAGGHRSSIPWAASLFPCCWGC